MPYLNIVPQNEMILCLPAALLSSITSHLMIGNHKNRNQVNYSAAPIISIIASIVVVFVMSLITGVDV